MVFFWYMFRCAFATMFLFAVSFNYASAGGLVPCGNVGQPSCQTCHLVDLTENIVTWLAIVMGTIAAILIIYGGLKLVASMGSAEGKQKAKGVIRNAMIGFLIVLACWFAIQFIMRAFLPGEGTVFNLGVWDNIQCVNQPELAQMETTFDYIRPLSASPENAGPYSPVDGANLANIITSSGDLATDIANAAIANGITDPEVIKLLQAQIAQESSGCQNKVGPPTRYGRAYGCGQILLSTARQLDPSGTSGLSDAQLAARLTDDNAYNLSLHSQYMSQLIAQNGGNVEYALAAYNGGGRLNSGCSSGAVCASSACPGALQYQCPYERAGCWDEATQQPNGNTGCGLETEFSDYYVQTGDYVKKITSGAASL